MSLLDRAARFIDDVLLLPEDMRATIKRAEDALSAGDPVRAEELLRGVLSHRPSLLRARQGLALALEARGELREARATLAVSRELDPDEPEIALLAARLALADGDPDEAIELARDAARRSASEGGDVFAEASVIHARAERGRGRPDRAARELRKAVAARPAQQSLRLELAEALASGGRGAAASAAIRDIDPSSIEPRAAAALGVALANAGQGERASGLLLRGASVGDVTAIRALAEIALSGGDLPRAERLARQAVARGGRAPALATLAAALRATGRSGEAAHALLAASDDAGGDLDLLRVAARLAPLDDPDTLIELATRLEQLAPGDAAARAARAWAALARGHVTEAFALTDGPRSSEPRLALAAACVALAMGRAQDAIDELGSLTLAGPDLAEAHRIRRNALRALWRGADGEIDLAAAIDAVARFAQARGLEDAQRKATALRDELDRPLLLAFLGEFNAGKSTLVNAFVGADVAPTGILPTTATLNLLRGGAERRVRVVLRDGTTREGDYEELKTIVASIGNPDNDAARIDHVEIVLPSELLERVWILDTPGSNAPLPEHEALAAEALRRADAALWIFDASQAGKATEGKLLAAIRASRRHVVAALNKVDRLSEGDVALVRTVLARELPEIGGDLVALSGKRALAARLAGDDSSWQRSGFPELVGRLERDVFARSRLLKRRACGGRLIAVLDETLATEAGAVQAHEARALELAAAAGPLERASIGLRDQVERAVTALEHAQTAAFEAAASEVLSFVRPRRNRFAKHGADLEDRAFLADTIERNVADALATCERRLGAEFVRALETAVLPLGIDRVALDERIGRVLAEPFARFEGYQRGILEGGALLRFFEDELPRAELAVEPLARALATARAHPSDHLRSELFDAATDLAASLEAERQKAARRALADRDSVQERVFEPLRALRDVLEELMQ